MSTEIIEQILAGYGLHDFELLPMRQGYRNRSFPLRLSEGHMANLIIFKREPDMLARIRRADDVAEFAHARGVPARYPLVRKVARLRSIRGEMYAALYAYLPGETIPWEAYTRRHLRLLGKSMSDLHAVLQDFDAVRLPDVVDEYLAIVARMQKYFGEPGVQAALSEKLGLAPPDLDHLPVLLTTCKRLRGQQALHMDFVRGNVLFAQDDDGLEVSGIIDFEKAAHGHPLFDIARTLAFLLVDCKYKSEADIRKYFLLSGYQKRGVAALPRVRVKTTGAIVDLLEELCSFFLCYDFYKFLRHNPYEFLPQNEHFVRTRDMLKARGQLANAPQNW